MRWASEISLTDAIGRVVEGAELSTTAEQAVITFTDGTFTTLGVDHGYGGAEIEQDELNIPDFGDEQLIRVGITTENELATTRAERKRRSREREAAAERDQYERLRAKFGAER